MIIICTAHFKIILASFLPTDSYIFRIIFRINTYRGKVAKRLVVKLVTLNHKGDAKNSCRADLINARNEAHSLRQRKIKGSKAGKIIVP